jgi:hypothetical protein
LKRFRETARQNREQERLRSDREAAKVALRQELQDQRIKEADDRRRAELLAEIEEEDRH